MAVILIISVMLLGFFLVSTERLNKMNKAAVAMFTGVLCWMIYIIYGSHFLVAEHQVDFLSYLSAHGVEGTSVKEYIAEHVFLGYAMRASEVVLFLLAVMTIVEVLNNNGCFDFISEWLRTNNARRFLWILAVVTFILSANIDNLITVCLMLPIMHSVIAVPKHRMIMGSVIVIAANLGGAFTVIGDVSSFSLWVEGLVTPTNYAMLLAVPSVAVLITFVLLVQRSLPERIALSQVVLPYRGDDTVFTRNQRLLLLFVGIGGLWFIPSFHRITALPPFVGALCVLAMLWIVNELCNRSLLSSDQMIKKRHPVALQYANIQNMLFYIGLTLTMGAVTETGALEKLFTWLFVDLKSNVYIVGAVVGAVSAFVNNVVALLANISLFSGDLVQLHPEIASKFATDGSYWAFVSFASSLGGSLFCIGTFSGFVLMRMEDVTLRWYFRHITPKVLTGWVLGMLVFYITVEWIY
jgi:Na+/H+ antiporter NhaD/arsenite permease-like protein